MSDNKLLDVNISSVMTADGFHILREINFELYSNETLCLIGESGSGKSMLGYSIMGLLPSNLKLNGVITYYKDRNVPLINPEEIRGHKITMIFQEPMNALNPLFTIGNQMCEAIKGCSKKESKERVIDALKDVGIKNAERVFESYPHQLSGGMRQRVLIAMAFLSEPSIVIADEPTTALDVTVASGILSLINSLKMQLGVSLIFISHDLNIVEKIATRIIVMYGGTIMESGTRSEILNNPLNPYTIALKRLFEERKKEGSNHLPEIKGYVPSIRDMPQGCPFNPRCERATRECINELPPMISESGHRKIRCFHYK